MMNGKEDLYFHFSLHLARLYFNRGMLKKCLSFLKNLYKENPAFISALAEYG
jgi:hypothetical protein